MEDPEPAAGEALVRVSGAVKDLIPIEFPHIPGMGVAGLVHKAAESVAGFEPGERVMALAERTYAEFCVVKATDLVKIPDGSTRSTASPTPSAAGLPPDCSPRSSKAARSADFPRPLETPRFTLASTSIPRPRENSPGLTFIRTLASILVASDRPNSFRRKNLRSDRPFSRGSRVLAHSG